MPETKRPEPWELADLCTPWCVHIVATLRVAQQIKAGIEQIEPLAAACGAHADSLQRVLRHLIGSKGMFAEPRPGRFVLNELAEVLLEPSAEFLNLSGFGGRMAYAWSTMLPAVRSGEPAYRDVFGRPFWDDLSAHPDIKASFDSLMGAMGHGIPDPEVLINGDWANVHTVVDVGGGTGTLLASVLKARPELRGILVDLPSTVADSKATFAEFGVADRVSTSGQSFFDPLPAGADLYLLKSVLADWPDREAMAILRRCAEAARPNGRVVLLNGVSPDEDGPASPNLLMLVLVGGSERTLSEFRNLAQEAGLEISTAKRQHSGRFLVECRPAR